MDDYYKIVGVERSASAAEIDRRSREQLRTWQSRASNADLARRHEAERWVAQLSEARAVLLDSTRRGHYDQQLCHPPMAADVYGRTNPSSGAAPAAQPSETSHAHPAVPGKRSYLVLGGAVVLAVGLAVAGIEFALPLLMVVVLGYFVTMTPDVSATRFRNRDNQR